MNDILDTFASFANLDYAAISEFVVRGGVSAFTVVGDLMKEYDAYIAGLHPDYFRGGYSLGKLVKQFLDYNINN